MADTDPRIQILVDEFGASTARAEDVLGELDQQSPDATVRRLQRDLWVAWGNDDVEWNLGRSLQIISELRDLADLQRELKRAFAASELDGGWRAAHDHPLYVQAEARAANLHDELMGLI